jgi:hypothetical protein
MHASKEFEARRYYQLFDVAANFLPCSLIAASYLASARFSVLQLIGGTQGPPYSQNVRN